jgi:H+/gluconate symporter-like permease
MTVGVGLFIISLYVYVGKCILYNIIISLPILDINLIMMYTLKNKNNINKNNNNNNTNNNNNNNNNNKNNNNMTFITTLLTSSKRQSRLHIFIFVIIRKSVHMLFKFRFKDSQ